eukprot:2387860-Prymnesium_polylepis.1
MAVVHSHRRAHVRWSVPRFRPLPRLGHMLRKCIITLSKGPCLAGAMRGALHAVRSDKLHEAGGAALGALMPHSRATSGSSPCCYGRPIRMTFRLGAAHWAAAWARRSRCLQCNQGLKVRAW